MTQLQTPPLDPQRFTPLPEPERFTPLPEEPAAQERFTPIPVQPPSPVQTMLDSVDPKGAGFQAQMQGMRESIAPPMADVPIQPGSAAGIEFLPPQTTDPQPQIDMAPQGGIPETDQFTPEGVQYDPTTIPTIDYRAKTEELYRTYDDKRTLGETWSRWAKNPTKSVPFLGGVLSAGELADVWSAAKAVEDEEATDRDLYVLMKYIKKGEEEPGFWAGASDFLMEVPAFAGEIATTGGIATAGRKVTSATLKKMIGKGLKEKAEALMKKKGFGAAVARGSAAVGKVGAGEAARVGLGMQHRIFGESIRRGMPGIGIDEAGEIAVEFQSDDGSLGEAILANYGEAFAATYSELVSEQAGGAIVKPLAKLKAGIMQRWLKANPTKKADDFMSKFAKAGAWHGPISEMGEERLNEVMTAVLTSDEYELPTWKQLGQELVAFQGPTVGAAAIRKLTPKPKAQPEPTFKTVAEGEVGTVEATEGGTVLTSVPTTVDKGRARQGRPQQPEPTPPDTKPVAPPVPTTVTQPKKGEPEYKEKLEPVAREPDLLTAQGRIDNLPNLSDERLDDTIEAVEYQLATMEANPDSFEGFEINDERRELEAAKQELERRRGEPTPQPEPVVEKPAPESTKPIAKEPPVSPPKEAKPVEPVKVEKEVAQQGATTLASTQQGGVDVSEIDSAMERGESVEFQTNFESTGYSMDVLSPKETWLSDDPEAAAQFKKQSRVQDATPIVDAKGRTITPVWGKDDANRAAIVSIRVAPPTARDIPPSAPIQEPVKAEKPSPPVEKQTEKKVSPPVGEAGFEVPLAPEREGQPPIQKIPREAVEEGHDPHITTARKHFNAKEREMLGLNELDSPETRSHAKALLEAKEEGLGSQSVALPRAHRVLKTRESLDDKSSAGLTLRKMEIKNEHEVQTAKVRKLNPDNAEDSVRIMELASGISNLEHEFNIISEALDVAGTAAGRALSARKITINQDYDLVSVLNRMKVARNTFAKGAPEGARPKGAARDVLAKDRKLAEKLTKELTEARETIARLETESETTVAQQGIARGRARRKAARRHGKAKSRKETATNLRALLKAGCK